MKYLEVGRVKPGMEIYLDDHWAEVLNATVGTKLVAFLVRRTLARRSSSPVFVDRFHEYPLGLEVLVKEASDEADPSQLG